MIRSWVTRFLGIDTLNDRLDSVESKLDANNAYLAAVDDNLSALLEAMAQRRDIEADTVRRLREINQAVQDGRVTEDNLVTDLGLADFDPQLGI